jgi:hypothetical protein
MNTLPTITSYGEYSSNNYGVHTKRLDLESITLWYSYDTIIAYRDNTDGMVICENVWGTTTGKHLNWINSDHSIRKPSALFDTMLAAACTRHNV